MFAPDFRKVMNTAKTLSDFESARKSLGDKTVGFVPTMGALHEGHASLIRRAVAECDAVVVSDFVNPTQFNNKTDFDTYPRILDQDSAFVEALGAAVLFAPRVEDIYPAGTDYNQRIFDLGGLDQYGEGPRRPGHFNGMAHFVRNLHYPIEIVRCPIARAEDGLALSSRNKLLTPAQRAAAPHIYSCIRQTVDMVGKMPVAEAVRKTTELIDAEPQLRTEYVEIINSLNLRPVSSWDEAEHLRLTCAVYAGEVRLIDNIALK